MRYVSSWVANMVIRFACLKSRLIISPDQNQNTPCAILIRRSYGSDLN